MKLNEVKIGDKIRFYNRYGTTIVTAAGYIYNILGDVVYVSEGRNIGGAQMWVCKKSDVICVIEESVISKEIPIDKPSPLVFEFSPQSAQQSWDCRRLRSATMTGFAMWKEGTENRIEHEIHLPWSECLQDMGAGGKFRVTIEKIA